MTTGLSMRAIVLALGILFAGQATAEVDAFMRAVGFALTGSDNTEPKAIDRASCIFQIGKDVFRLNNVHTDRLLFQPWHSRDGSQQWVVVELHGDATVYEHTTEPLKDDGSEFMREMRRAVPNAFQSERLTYKEHQVRLDTADLDRVKRASVYLYGHGCAGKKSPF
jgi:hypothetical protein